MRISSFSSSHSQMGGTRTYEDFHKWVGERPERLGIVTNLYKQYTATALTEALMNVWTVENKPNKFQPLNSFMVEWEIETNFVKRIPILAVDGDGANGSEVIFQFPEHYYEMYDVFVIEATRQQCFVMHSPIRRSDACWEYACRIIDNDYSERISEDVVGTDTRFVTNHMPELHETGYTKYQSNIEKHRTYIGTHRVDVDYSAKYRAMEDHFIQIATKDKEFTLKLPAAEKVCLDNFMSVRNNKLLFSKGNIDANGRATISDDLGRPIIATDGIIPQAERFATKFAFNEGGFGIRLFESAMEEMANKCDQAQGNTWVFVCNSRMYNFVQRRLARFLADWKTDGAFVWSKGANNYVKVGATYDSYTYAGNTITFKQDVSLNLEYPNKAFGMFLDLTADSNGVAGLMFFTFRGGELIHNVLRGVGGLNGLESGEVASPVAGSKIVNWGYAGVGVMNPYRTAILEEI